MERLLRIGVITRPHGLLGDVKVYPTTDSARRFNEVRRVVLKTKSGDVETEITRVRFFKNLAIVKFDCFNSVEEVQGLSGTDVMIYREDAQPLEEGEYYIADLLGCEVVTDVGDALGTVRDVLQTGANDVYVVKTAGKDLLLPVIPECILNVDIENMKITCHMMPGLENL